uniref:Uncharacterized protein n=1 Tax=Rhizophora mucronata TaxID=61149 RepID=A0A2P2NP07_RHIMU
MRSCEAQKYKKIIPMNVNHALNYLDILQLLLSHSK